jgi:hypothetical protein
MNLYADMLFSLTANPVSIFIEGTEGTACTNYSNTKLSRPLNTPLNTPPKNLGKQFKKMVDLKRDIEIPPLYDPVISWENKNKPTVGISNLEEFKGDFDNLVQYYTNNERNSLDFKPFAVFCSKYGSPFNDGNASISLENFYTTFYRIRDFQKWQFDEVLFDELFTKIKEIVEEFPTDENVFIRIISQEVATELKNTISHQIRDNIVTTPNFALIVGNKFRVTEELTRHMIIDPLIITKPNEIPQEDCLQWLKHKLLANLAKPLEDSISKTHLSLENGLPKVNMTINNKILFHLFEMLFKKHARCKAPGCGKLLEVRSHQRDYCGNKCIQKSYSKTGKGQLDNLYKTWKSRKVFDGNAKKWNDLFAKAAEKIKAGQTYESVKTELQEFRKGGK